MSNPSTSFTCNSLLKPCKKFLRTIKRPISIRAFQFCNLCKAVDKMMIPRRHRRFRVRSVRAVFWPLITRSHHSDPVREVSLLDRIPAPLPSPVTPSYVKVMVKIRGGEGVHEKENSGVNNACKSFESYLMEMLVEERKIRDLMDVEELMHCWERLKSPVFIELMCRFYSELCKDLFPCDEQAIESVAEANYVRSLG